ncbi:MAG: hypothetical protein J5737_03075 [Bacteroidales bacterium]|nr:hypothetical protein [Bacteroidales bacterium]
MKKRIIICVLTIILLPAAAGAAVPPGSPADPLKKDFSEKIIEQTPPEGANALEKAAWFVNNQLVGQDFYEPVNYMFFRQAVRTIGFFPAVFATADRILRDSRIGTAGARLDAGHRVIREGPEAYAPGKKK